MFLYSTDAFLYALYITLGLAVLNAIVRTRYSKVDFVAIGISALVALPLMYIFNWMILWWGRPVLAGPLKGHWFLAVPLFIGMVVFFVGDLFSNVDENNRDNDQMGFGISPLMALLTMVFFLFFFMRSSCVPISQGQATHLANLIHVEQESVDAYPDTDANHIVLVPEDSVIFKQNQVIAKGSDDRGRNLASIYQPGKPELQSINDHLYWVSALEFTSWRSWDQVQQTSPGYILVDAEDPSAQPQLKLGYKMKYVPSAWFANKLERKIYDTKYKHYKVDDLTLEIDDDGRPFYTASLNRPTLHNEGSVPVGFIIVDPETAQITEYPLDQVPDWVDRVYSAETAKRMVNWWGNYGDQVNAPFRLNRRPRTNRFHVSGEPVLVYTKGGHPDWQMLITSLNDDTSVISLILFDARDNRARVYPLLSGTPIESDVIKTFEGVQENVRGDYQAKHASMHKIFGEATWVVSYVLATGEGKGKPFQGIGLVPARAVTGANVVFTPTKEEAFSLYRQKLARISNNEGPQENRLTKDTRGTVAAVVSEIENGETIYLIYLVEDPAHLYKASRLVSSEIGFTKPGDSVAIQYIDIQNTADQPYDVSQFNNLDLPIVK